MDIKKYNDKLKPYSIHAKRTTTINHAFASALAPYHSYNDKVLREAMACLNLDPDNLKCFYCSTKKATTLDHIEGLVKNSEFKGRGHQIGNLVPACGDCNSKKGKKSFKDFLNEKYPRKKEKQAELEKKLKEYQRKYSCKLNLEELYNDEDYKKYIKTRDEITKMLETADKQAKKLRDKLKLQIKQFRQ